MEMMHRDAGVKNVVIGGRPSYGPMQTPSGSRGARDYDLIELDADISNAISLVNDSSVFPNRTNQDVYVYDGGVSLRAQVREGETVPLAMQYEAADCRIFLTPDTFNNFTNLWRYAANVMWTSPQFCVQGSTGYATTTNTSESTLPPPSASPPAAVNYSSIGIPIFDNATAINSFLISDLPMPDLVADLVSRKAVPVSKIQTSQPIDINAPKSGNSQGQPPKYNTLGQVSKACKGNTAPGCSRRKRRSVYRR